MRPVSVRGFAALALLQSPVVSGGGATFPSGDIVR